MPEMMGGGAEKVLVDILKNIDYEIFDVSLLLEFKGNVYWSDIPKQVNVYCLNGENTLNMQRFHRALRILHCYGIFISIYYRFILWLKFRRKKYDTIVSFMEGAAVKLHYYMFSKSEKHISWVHIDLKRKHWSLEYLSKEEEYFIYKRMAKIVFVSEDAKDAFLSMYDINRDKCVVQYNLIDDKKILELSLSKLVEKKKFTICMVGRLNHQKRYDRAIEAVSILKSRGWDFEMWILGTGELYDTLKEKCKKYSVDDSVIFKGFVKPAYPYMRVADVYLNTSEAEGYPLVLCEAVCLGLPIVATNITGAREIIGNGNGILVEETALDIANGLELLIKDKDYMQHFKTKSSERAKMFDASNVMQSIYNII